MKLTLASLFFISSYTLCQNTSIEEQQFLERILTTSLSKTNAIAIQESQECLDALRVKVSACNYKDAILIVMSYLERFPENFAIQSYFAALTGDYSELTEEPFKQQLIDNAKNIFNRLRQESVNQSKDTLCLFTNEYCYRFALYKEQYENGLEAVAHYWETPEKLTCGVRGYYYQGVGAANYAKILWLEGNKALATEYAHKAVVAWAQYFSHKNNYYNAYVHYALALGVLGHKEEMMRALKHSAQLINRDLDYQEFKDVTEFFDKR